MATYLRGPDDKEYDVKPEFAYGRAAYWENMRSTNSRQTRPNVLRLHA